MKFLAVGAVAVLVLAPGFAPAQDMPVPKALQDLQGRKGQWQVEFLEHSGREGKAKPPAMTLCTDNLMRSQAQRERTDNLMRSQAQRERRAERQSECTHRLLKDTPAEAILESSCPERKNVVTITREGPASLLMSSTSSGPRGEQTVKIRYRNLGACREGQGAVTFDKDSEQCRRLKERAAKVDPEKQCARRKTDAERATCEQRVRDAAAKLSAMCS